MPPRRELCRNFQSGSCRYGSNCKFLHVTQQQPRSNTFGFGSQTGTPFQQTSAQQQKSNPFGFGVQSSGQANGTANSGGLGQRNAKPFENKWVRSEQPANQSQAASHNCADPDSCKSLMAEDFKQEKPLWGLTCYGHYKYLPCDITGDISYEELRAEAYNDSKRGVMLQSIVERERNLWNSKLAEFKNLLQNPYTKHAQAAPNQSPFPTIGSSLPSLTTQNSVPSPFSSFGSQPGSSANMTFGVRPSTPSSGFAQFQGPGPFGNAGAHPGPFGTQVPAQPSPNPFPSNVAGSGNSTLSNHSTQFPSQTGANPFPFALAGSGNSTMNTQGNQVPVQTGGNPFTTNMSGFTSNGMSTPGSQLPSTSVSSQIQTPAISQTPIFSDGLGGTNVAEQRSNIQQEVSPVDASIWLKQEWKIGEIPEQPPPPEYVR